MEEPTSKKQDKREPLLIVTHAAANQIRKLQQNFGGGAATKSLRIRVKQGEGGCSGLGYEMKFEGRGPGDQVVKIKDDICIVVDPESARSLKGAMIDFEDGPQGKGFKIENPNVKSSCGCGKSSC